MNKIKLKVFGGYSLFLIITTIVLLFMLNRLRFGIDFSDEAWYVAEPYSVSELGLKPFINNVSQTPGFTVPLALAYKLFILINESTEGIFLFSRILYLIVTFIIATVTILLVRKYLCKNASLLYIPFLLMSFACYSLYDLNYNTIGLAYFPLIISLALIHMDEKDLTLGIIAGLLAVRATIATPTLFAGLVVIFIYLCFSRRKKKIVGIIVGCLLSCISIAMYIAFNGGINSFYNWLVMYISQGYFSLNVTKDWGYSIKCIILLVIPCAFMFILLFVVRNFTKNNKRLWIRFREFAVYFAITIGIVICFITKNYNGFFLVCCTWFLPFCNLIFSEDNRKEYIIPTVITISYLTVFLLSSFTDGLGFGPGRAYWMIGPIGLVLLDVNGDNDSKLMGVIPHSAVPNLMIVLYLIFGMWSNYSYVYRDADIALLDTKVVNGAWKGLYTTKERANCSVELENYLQSITDQSDYVLYLDWVSFAYLLGKGKICSPTTLDACLYSYRVNDPSQYYDYFAYVGKVPNKIIYIDYGRDPNMSIDDAQWEFSKFVRECYAYDGDFSNDMFEVKKYVIESEEDAWSFIRGCK